MHGGAAMVLHPLFPNYQSTQDVDYTHRSLESARRAVGFPHAEQRLRTCGSRSQAQSRRGLDERPRRCGASLGPRVRDDTNPLTRFRSNFIFYLIAASKDARTIRSSTPRPTTKTPCCKRSSASPRSRPRRRSVALGHRAQTGALREAGPDRLRRGSPPRRSATRHPLDARRTRAVDHEETIATNATGKFSAAQ